MREESAKGHIKWKYKYGDLLLLSKRSAEGWEGSSFYLATEFDP